jgi:ABC-2 type transport system ATP-binding protein
MFELLQRMADQGRTVLLSSHILEEVERIAASVLVIYAGRLAASGDFRSIRRLMTDRPHEFFVRSGDDRRLGSILLAEKSVFGVEIDPKGLLVRTSDFGRFTKQLPRIAQRFGIRILELTPTDDSLESVFAYLVGR